MQRALTSLITAAIVTLSSLSISGFAASDLPPHPDQITFAPLVFDPPQAEEYRHTLSNGVVVYMAPSHEFPLIDLSFTFRGGSYLDPSDKIGLAATTGAMIRRGGSASLSARELDEEFDFLAAQVSSFCGDVMSGASINSLKSNFDQSLALFMDMVRNPRFQEDRLAVYKSEVIEAMKQRNDDADPILSREWRSLLFGSDHFEAALPTRKMIESITVEDLRAMHQRIFHPAPGNLIVAVSGDFDPDEMLARLEQAFADWEPRETNGDPPQPSATLTPGIYHVEKDIPQGKVFIGMRGLKRDDPDFIPAMVMNHILGGGGFTSRITNRVRSDEGLAYAAGSSLTPKVWYPGEFRVTFQSKNETVALATKLVFEEIQRIRSEGVTPEELEIAKNSFIETFPRMFESKPAMLRVFVTDELTNRPKDYWHTYRDRVRAVTAEDVQRVATRYLQPENMMILVVGKWDEIAKGDRNGRASMSEFFNGNVTHLPLRDPLTLEPLQQ